MNRINLLLFYGTKRI